MYFINKLILSQLPLSFGVLSTFVLDNLTFNCISFKMKQKVDKDKYMEPLHIAVCEDSVEEQKNLLAILERSEIPIETAVFSNGEDFLKVYQPGKYDLLFMDIYMGGMTGVEVVTEIRKTDETLVVAFITASTEHTLESYRLKVLQYIEKPLKEKAVLELLAFAKLKRKDAPRLLLKIGVKEVSLPFDQILYAEQKNHTLYLNLTGGEILKANTKLDTIEPQFTGQPFFRCHKSYLVNLCHVVELDKCLRVFVMKEGATVYIRRESLAKAKKAFADYLFSATRKMDEIE